MTEKVMTETCAAGWCKLQRISCHHAAKIYGKCRSETSAFQRYHSIGVPYEIDENVEILGRGNEEEIKNRIHWYYTYFPDIMKELQN